MSRLNVLGAIVVAVFSVGVLGTAHSTPMQQLNLSETAKSSVILVQAEGVDAQATFVPTRSRCEWRAFEVNDFGKEGPIKLARQDLANYVEKIKKREGVKRVRVSAKKPTCKLFLWLGPASEYTCRIEARMCW